MIICYMIYCVVLHFNTPLEKWAYSLKLPIKLPTKEEQSALVTFKNVADPSYSQGGLEANGGADQQQQQQQQQHQQIADGQQQEQNYQGYNNGTE